MAMGITFICSVCKRAIETWDDGNPYYIDKTGEKQYAHHPDHILHPLCIGNDAPYLCLMCGHEFMVDSCTPKSICPACGAKNITGTGKLEGKRCPFCKAGEFVIDPDSRCIS